MGWTGREGRGWYWSAGNVEPRSGERLGMERLREEKLKLERSRGVRLGMERLEGMAGNGEAERGGTGKWEWRVQEGIGLKWRC